jgi:3-oxoadipate enol-lactonase
MVRRIGRAAYAPAVVGGAAGTVGPMAELVLPWVPEGRLVRVDGRGELFARVHRHPDPAAPVVLLLHGWTASSDLQFVAAYEALAARYTFVGIDHRGHGRGLRAPDPFTLEDAADDAAALVRALGLGPVVTVGYSMGGPISMLLARRHPDLVSGLVVQATALDWRHTLRDRFLWRVLPIAGSWLRTKGYRRYLNRAVPKVIGLTDRGAATEHPVQRYIPWLVSEMARNDPFVMVEAGRALADYDARPWASSLGVPAASLVTTADRLVLPAQQRALAAALGATTREVRADHLASLSHPEAYAAMTVELIEDVRQRASVTSSASGVT